MNSRRDFPQQDRFERGRDDSRSFSREQHRGGQYGGQPGWRGSRSDWDADAREGASYGSGQDRFGGYSGSMDYGNPYEPRQQNDGSRQNPWDEDRFGYPESASQGHEMGRGAQGRFGEDRYSWGQPYSRQDMGRSLAQTGAYDPPRHFEPRRSSSYDAGWGQGASGGGSGESFAGGRGRYGGDQWGGGHSGRFGSDTGLRGRPPKGYTRSDDRIRDDVCEQLYRTPDIDVGEVTVEARNGTVILEGTVPDRRMKHRIEDLCEQCIGVLDVENRIRVLRQDRHMTLDADRSPMPSTGTSSSSQH